MELARIVSEMAQWQSQLLNLHRIAFLDQHSVNERSSFGDDFQRDASCLCVERFVEPAHSLWDRARG